MLGALTGVAVVPAGAQDSAAALEQQVRMRMMIEQIARQRPQQAESAAQQMVRVLQLQQAALDSLRRRSLDQYWREVAQLTVQREMLTQQLDSLRQPLMVQLFATEAQARALQRDYQQPLLVVNGVPLNETAGAARERSTRERLQALMERHLAAEDSLRSLEIADVERRLSQVRAETERRRRERAELARQMVDQILRDAERQ